MLSPSGAPVNKKAESIQELGSLLREKKYSEIPGIQGRAGTGGRSPRAIRAAIK